MKFVRCRSSSFYPIKSAAFCLFTKNLIGFAAPVADKHPLFAIYDQTRIDYFEFVLRWIPIKPTTALSIDFGPSCDPSSKRFKSLYKVISVLERLSFSLHY